MSETTVIAMPIYVFVNDKLACQCTRKDAPIRIEAYQRIFPHANVRGLSALQAVKAGLTIPKARSRKEDYDNKGAI